MNWLNRLEIFKLASSALKIPNWVDTSYIGDGTKIWQYAVVMRGAVIGQNCQVGAHSFIESNVTIGNEVTIKNGAMLFEPLIIEDGVFIGPGVIFSNDKYPKSIRNGSMNKHFPLTKVCIGASIGAGAIILPGLTIGENALIGAGSVITSDVAANSLVLGSPGRRVQGRL